MLGEQPSNETPGKLKRNVFLKLKAFMVIISNLQAIVVFQKVNGTHLRRNENLFKDLYAM